ncbi:MAG: TetR/AcrR family transcriptional regulator [Caulobacterales bacterium]|jgi:AcrR family transcriptional regulator
MKHLEKPGKTPRQARAKASLEAILEAAAQLLEARGEAGFNTNAVAERAGVSIGTLYRYFPDKRAILAALAAREMRAANEAIAAALAGGAGLAPDRAAIRAFLQAFDGRSRARRIVVAELLSRADPQALAAGHSVAAQAMVDAKGRPLSPIAAFVLTRALHGAMRAAVMEDADFLLNQAFEDELVRLSRAYVRALGSIAA